MRLLPFEIRKQIEKHSAKKGNFHEFEMNL
jgi:hypothetical protein